MHVRIGARPKVRAAVVLVSLGRLLDGDLDVSLDLDTRGMSPAPDVVSTAVAVPSGYTTTTTTTTAFHRHRLLLLLRVHDALLALGQNRYGVQRLGPPAARVLHHLVAMLAAHRVRARVLQLEAARLGGPATGAGTPLVVAPPEAREAARPRGEGAQDRGDDDAEELPEHGQVGRDDGDEGLADGPGAGQLGAVDGVLFFGGRGRECVSFHGRVIDLRWDWEQQAKR